MEKEEEMMIFPFARTNAPPLEIRISGFISLKKPRQFCSPLDVEIPIKYPYSLHPDNISSVYSDYVDFEYISYPPCII